MYNGTAQPGPGDKFEIIITVLIKLFSNTDEKVICKIIKLMLKAINCSNIMYYMWAN